MLIKEFAENLGFNPPTCASCRQRPAEIRIRGYTEVDTIDLCADCALLLARTLLENLCDLRTLSSRYG